MSSLFTIDALGKFCPPSRRLRLRSVGITLSSYVSSLFTTDAFGKFCPPSGRLRLRSVGITLSSYGVRGF
jgi:hypothetical protein